MNISLRDAAALEGINADTSCGAESDHQERTRASRGVHSPQVAMLTDGELRRYGKIGFNCPDSTSMSRRLNS